MTVARMHSQRKVVRGRYVPRFTKQRKIARGGGDTGDTPPVPTPVLTTVTPTSVVVDAGATVFTFTGTDFVDGCAGSTGPTNYPTTFVSSTEISVTFTVGASPGTIQFFVKNNPAGATQAEELRSNLVNVTVSASEEDPQTFLAQGHTVAETEAWVDAHPQYADEALSWEQGHQNRTTLTDWLEGFISDRDEGHIP